MLEKGIMVKNIYKIQKSPFISISLANVLRTIVILFSRNSEKCMRLTQQNTDIDNDIF